MQGVQGQDGKLKAKNLRGHKRDLLESELERQKHELGQLRVAKVTGGAPTKLGKIGVVRKHIALINTVISQSVKGAVRKSYEGKKFKPNDCRQKKTRALRRALKPSELNKRNKKQRRKASIYPQRKFAVKA